MCAAKLIRMKVLFLYVLLSFDSCDHAGVPSVEMGPAVRGAVDALLQQLGREAALRCIALAYKELPSGQSTLTHEDEQGLVFLGVLGLHDPPRPCLLYTSPSPRDRQKSRMPSSA